MKLLRITWLAVLCGITILPSVSAAPARPQPRRLVGKVVLRLHSRGPTNQPLKDPYRLGFFTVTGNEYCGVFEPKILDRDKHGSFYILDPISESHCVMKCFSSVGKFSESWAPLDDVYCSDDMGALVSAAVTDDGYVWLALGDDAGDEIPGLPVVIYRRGQKAPVADWRTHLPSAVFDALRQALVNKGGPVWNKGISLGWSVLGLTAVSKTVGLELEFHWALTTDTGGIKEQYFYVRLLANDAGTMVKRVEMHGNFNPNTTSSAGRTWHPDIHTTPSGQWSRLASGNDEQMRIGPHDFDGYRAQVKVGRNGTLYLRLTKKPQTKIRSNATPSYAEVILNQDNQPIGYLPWTEDDEVIFPKPDGSGFYMTRLCVDPSYPHTAINNELEIVSYPN